MKTAGLVIFALALYVLHQDYWNWSSYEPLIFGFLPVGLAYHGAFSVLCAVMMFLMVKFAWPAHLDEEAPSAASGEGK